MKLKVWENVIVSWVNALSLLEIKDIHALKNGNFFLNILDRLQYKGDGSFKDVYYSPDDIHPYVVAFIKDVYPDYDIPGRLNCLEDITLIASLILLWFCLKTKDKELLMPLYSLGHSTQCCIQAFLEKLLYIPSSSVTKDLLFSAIVSIDESYSKDSVACASPASPSVYNGRPEIFMSPVADKVKEEIKTLKREIELVRSENNHLLGELDQMKFENNNKNIELELKKKDILRLENEVFILSGEANSSRKEKRRSGGSSREKKLKIEVDELEKLVVSLKQEINNFSDTRNNLKKKIGDLDAENTGWKDRVSEIEERCCFLETQLSQKESVINQLQQTVVEQREYLSETYGGNVTVANDSSLCEEITSPCLPENLTSVVEVKYNELESDYQLLTCELNKTKVALQDKDKRIYSLMAEVNTNTHEIQRLEEERIRNEECLNLKHAQKKELDSTVILLKNNIEELMTEKESCLSDIKNLTSTVDKLKSENINFNNQIASLNDAIKEQMSAVVLKDREVEKLKSVISEKDSILSKTIAENENFKKTVASQLDVIENLKSKVNEVTLESAKLKDLLNKELAIQENFKHEKGKLKEKISELEKQNSQLSSEMKSLFQSKEAVEMEKKNCLLCIDQLKEQSEASKSEIISKCDLISEQQTKISVLNSEIADSKSTVEELWKEKKELVEKTKSLLCQNQELTEKCTKISKEMKSCKNQMNELKKEVNNCNEEKKLMSSRTEEWDQLKKQIKVLESELSNLNEFRNLDQIQMKKNAEEKNKLTEELSFKQREIEGLTLQLIESKQIQEAELSKYKELLEKLNEVKQLNESHLNDLVIQRKKVTELESENLQHVYEISCLREAKEKFEAKVKEQFDNLTVDIESLKSLRSQVENEKLVLLDEKCCLENKMKELENELYVSADSLRQVEKLKLTIKNLNEDLEKAKNENKKLSEEVINGEAVISKMEHQLQTQVSKISTMEIEMENINKIKESLDLKLIESSEVILKLEEQNVALGKIKTDIEYSQEVFAKELELVMKERDKLKDESSKYELYFENLSKENNTLSANQNSLNQKLQSLVSEVEEKDKLLEACENKISDLTNQFKREKAISGELISENKDIVDKNQFLILANEELQRSLQEKNNALNEFKKEVLSVEQNMESIETEYSKLNSEKTSLTDEINNLKAKAIKLESQVIDLSKEVADKTSVIQHLTDDLSNQKELLAKADVKNKEVSQRVETLNDLIMQYCITIQENTTYVSELKTKMNSYKDSVASKEAQLLEITQEKKVLNLKYEESLKNCEQLNSSICALKDVINSKDGVIFDLKSLLTELECSKKDLSKERDHLSELINTYTDELSVIKNKLNTAEDLRVKAETHVKSLQEEISQKDSSITNLNKIISGLKYGLIENSNLLKQILNETRFFGEVTMKIHDDVNDSLSGLNTSGHVVNDGDLTFPSAESPFDPAFSSKWRDLQSEIIKALKVQLDCVYSAAKEKDALCNDLNIKINDLISENRKESNACELHRSKAAELKKQIDDLTESTKELLAKKDETILALKEELSFLSDCENKDEQGLKIKIEQLIEFNSELEFKLNQAQLERDFFKEESEQLTSLKTEIKEKDGMVVKLMQDIEMLEHEKNILDKRVVFLTKDAEDIKSLKIELSDIKNKFSILDIGEQCGDIEHLTDEEKLTRIKPEYLKNDLDGNSLPSTSGLREQNNSNNIIRNSEKSTTPQTHTKIKSLFTAKPKQSIQEGAVKKKSGFFRRKKERENISPSS